MYNPFSLEGKSVLITGASSGIGRATAIECAKLGARVIITGRNSKRLQETYDELDGNGHLQIVADLSTTEGVELVVDNVDSIDGLVNNAGVSNTKLIQFIKENDLEDVFQTNLFAPILLTRTLLKQKKINKKASIVFTSSAASINPDLANSVYSATKAAVASFSRSCAKELCGKLIRSNSVHPGMVQTKMVDNLVFSEDELAKDKERYPLQRYGTPEDVAWAIVYLLSDASAWVTGTQLIVDGGVLLGK